MSNVKQVIVVRKDLKMRRGKEAAQVAHASMKVFFDITEIITIRHPDIGIVDVVGKFSITKPMMKWMNGTFTKIVLSCDSEEELFKLQKQAKEAQIINAIIQDSGQTEFKEICPDCNGRGYYKESFQLTCPTCKQEGKINKPTYTCLAIGPYNSEEIDKITGQLKLR